jgi:outer membrane protein assembly factor BamB
VEADRARLHDAIGRISIRQSLDGRYSMKRALRSPWWIGIALPGLVATLVLWSWPRVWSQQKQTPQTGMLARVILESVDTPAGFCIHLGVRDGELTTALSQEGKRLIHGLAGDDAAVEAARKRIEAANLTGVVSVEKTSWDNLPYADNLANLLVAEDLPALIEQGLDLREVQRVLKPGGVAWLGGAGKGAGRESLAALLRDSGMPSFEIVEQNGLWAKVVTPPDPAADQWTHKQYDASGNPVSHDHKVGVPTGVRWVAGPNWPTGYRKSAVPSVVATKDHLVYLFQDEVETSDGAKPQDTLVARDAHNGLLLWKRKATKHTSALAAVDDRVYAVVEDGGPLAALDSRSGEILTTYEGTRAPKQVLHLDGRLLIESPDGLLCCDAASGRKEWIYECSLKQFVAADGKVFLHADDRDKSGARVSQFVRLDLDQGKPEWRQPTEKWAEGSPTLIFVFDDVLVAASKKGNHGVSARDGSHLWSYEYPTIGHGGSYAKVLAMHDLVWVHTAKAEGTGRYAWEGLDPKTGKVKKQIVQPKGFSMKHRCSYDVATTRLIMCGSMDFADYETGEYHHFDAARNSCATAGVRPANGILYTFPHGCGCYPMLRGFLGLESKQAPATWAPGDWRLIQGPAFGKPAAAISVSDQDWPSYRRDSLRTGSTSASAPTELDLLWSAQVAPPVDERLAAEWDLKDGGRLSSPVIAGDVAIAAATDAHRIAAVDAKSGEPRWTFTAGGRIDCPPTVHEGLCLFGARDGWVYCVRADTGELVWRFCAAPRDERIIAYGQLESKWPVVGGVLVYEGLAYFGVGRHGDSDGGVTVCAVEPDTGKLVWSEHAADYQGIPDVLAAADGAVYMASYRFDAKTGESRDAREALLRGGRLGLLNDAWYLRPIAMRRNLQQWQAPDRGSAQMMAYHADATCGFLACESVAGGDGKMSGDAKLYVRNAKGREAWEREMPNDARLRGMAITTDRAYVAGLLPVERGNDLEYVVQAYSLDAGKLLSEREIGSPPVHDGLAIADGRVYVSLQDGRLLCLGEK